MAFECQESTEIGFSKNSIDFLHKSYKELGEFQKIGHLVLKLDCESKGKKSEIRGSKLGFIPKQAAVPNPYTRIHIDDSELDCESKPAKLEISKPTLGFSPKKGVAATLSLDSKLLSCNDFVPTFYGSINDLPPVIISEILNCLDPKELGIVSCVSPYLHGIASGHRIWKEFYCDRWEIPVAPSPIGSGVLGEKSWKELFVEREFRSKTFMGRFTLDVLHGHTEAVRTVFLLSSAKIVFTSGYDFVVRMWDMEEGFSIGSSRPLGCTIRAVAADTKLLVAGGTDGFIHCWRAVDGYPYLFDLRGSQNQNTEFRLWEHQGAITCLALDINRIYSGSWDTTVRIWDRSSLKCLKVLTHSDWVWGLAPHDSSVACTSGSDTYVWDTNNGTLITVIYNAHEGNTYSLARSRAGNLLFTGGEDGAIHMFEITSDDAIEGNFLQVATWIPHSGPVHSLAFEYPWLVSASSDGKLSLIDVRKLLRTNKRSSKSFSRLNHGDKKNVEPPQRMLHGYGCNLFSVAIGCDRIVCGGEEGVVRIWNFSQALERELRACASREIRAENRTRRRALQVEMNSKGGRRDQCSVAAKKNPVTGDRKGVWVNKRGMSGKLKA